jgi:hypothetical protein
MGIFGDDEIPVTSRHVIIIGLFQVVLVVYSTLVVGTFLRVFKEAGYPGSDLARWIREWGFQLLLVPLIWSAITSYFVSWNLNHPKWSRFMLSLGILLIVLDVMVAVAATVSCFRVHFIMES